MVSVIFGDQLQDVSGDDDELAEFLGAAPTDPPRMAPNPAAARFREQAAAESSDDDDELIDLEEFEEDPEPFEKPSVSQRLLGGGKGSPSKPSAGARTRRPTATVQKDVRAKTAMLLSIPATVWQARDRYCGAAAMESVPEISDALADIFCDSPEIVAWFTSSGQFVKYLKLAASLKELTMTIFAHHVAHTIGDDVEEDQSSDWSQYVA